MAWPTRNLLKRIRLSAVIVLPVACGACNSQPSAQEYQLRARFGEAAVTADQVEMVIATFRIRHDAWPTTIEQAAKEDTEDQVPALPTKDVQSIMIGANGDLAVTFRPDVPELGGKSFVMSPVIATDGSISWKCAAPAIPEKYRVRKCLAQ